MRITLDNAQSGGSQITIENNGKIVGKIYPRAENKDMIYWDFGKNGRADKLSEMVEEDGIVLYEDKE